MLEAAGTREQLVIEQRQPSDARTAWINAYRAKMVESNSQIDENDTSELAEALSNLTSLRGLGVIATASRLLLAGGGHTEPHSKAELLPRSRACMRR